jgi:transposase-like protein
VRGKRIPRIMRRKSKASEEIPLGRWREAEARRVVALWRESGLSACAFARAHGLADEQRLSWWRKRLEKKSETTALAPLTFIPAELTGTAAAAVVRLSGDVVLELADVAAVPTSWVAALASELKRQS